MSVFQTHINAYEKTGNVWDKESQKKLEMKVEPFKPTLNENDETALLKENEVGEGGEVLNQNNFTAAGDIS